MNHKHFTFNVYKEASKDVEDKIQKDILRNKDIFGCNYVVARYEYVETAPTDGM